MMTDYNRTLALAAGAIATIGMPAVSAPAGMYMAELGDTRASWVVRPDQSIMGTQDKMSRRDDELIGQILQDQQNFQDDLRQMRIDRQLQPAADDSGPRHRQHDVLI
jgi:hypothetical protein